MTHTPELLTLPEVADVLRVTVRHVYYLVDAGRLPAHQLSPKAIRVSRDDLNNYIEKSRVVHANS